MSELGDGQFSSQPVEQKLRAVLDSGKPFQNVIIAADGRRGARLRISACRVPGLGDQPPLILLSVEDETREKLARP